MEKMALAQVKGVVMQSMDDLLKRGRRLSGPRRS